LGAEEVSRLSAPGRLAYLAVLGVLSVGAPALACPLQPNGTELNGNGERFGVAMRPAATPVRVGQSFSIVLTACDANGAPFTGELKVDAAMPMHKHGMNYRPTVMPLGGGKYKADGFLFHMPGRWQYRIELRASDSVERIMIDQTVTR